VMYVAILIARLTGVYPVSGTKPWFDLWFMWRDRSWTACLHLCSLHQERGGRAQGV